MSLVDKAMTHKKLAQENQQLKSALKTKHKFDQNHCDLTKFIISDLVERVADSESSAVLVTGESGTGKELIARPFISLHPGQPVRLFPLTAAQFLLSFLKVNFLAILKGPSPAPISNRVGRFELADGGTLFLDEIGDLEPTLQVKILRALQERCFEPVGSAKTVQVNVRVIAATNIDLEKAVELGKFREDLFYRLNISFRSTFQH